MDFNPAKPSIMHVDINSCFAAIEQQANPHLRGKPVAVAAFTTPAGCILAASVEAKRLGIKTGMRVGEGREIYPELIVLPPDPWKYRFIHLKLKKLLLEYAPEVYPRSIDEFVLKPACPSEALLAKGDGIKRRIREEIGEWITVSVGIASNRYLAKIAAGLRKPDGLDEINKDNFLKVYKGLALRDLTGIKYANEARLNSVGIYSVLDFYSAPVVKIKAAFHSITGLYWHMRLAGYEVDDVEFARRSYGNSVALGRNLSKVSELSPILARLTEKMSARIRAAGYKARGIHLALLLKNGGFWHKGRLTVKELFDSRDFFKEARRLLVEALPLERQEIPVANIAVSSFALTKNQNSQLELFCDVPKNESLTRAVDEINKKWGDFTLGLASARRGENVVLDRIAFGGVRELEQSLQL